MTLLMTYVKDLEQKANQGVIWTFTEPCPHTGKAS